ncbi:MAG: hypothetical protein IKR86_02355 [Candidatus Methanomethylophilaceae archaeon]|nr:hypothetical protein [Candidatus Methanomethylophilaceae archaeon]
MKFGLPFDAPIVFFGRILVPRCHERGYVSFVVYSEIFYVDVRSRQMEVRMILAMGLVCRIGFIGFLIAVLYASVEP